MTVNEMGKYSPSDGNVAGQRHRDQDSHQQAHQQSGGPGQDVKHGRALKPAAKRQWPHDAAAHRPSSQRPGRRPRHRAREPPTVRGRPARRDSPATASDEANQYPRTTPSNNNKSRTIRTSKLRASFPLTQSCNSCLYC